jgi:hypothetical protein
MSDLKIYSCLACNYSTKSNSNFHKHFKSSKHINNVQFPDSNITNFHCIHCNKYYKAQSGLWSHKKVCKHNVQTVQIVVPCVQENTVQSNRELNNQEILGAMNIMSEQINRRMDKLSSDLKENQQIVQTINNNSTTINNTFNMTVFLNEKCGEAINFEEFIKRIMFEFANSTLMMESYVEGTCNIIQRNLEQLPVNKRPMHCLVGEDPHQQLLHIRQDDKWNTSSELNWMQQIHADDDDDVVNKNPIYYGLQKIDDKKLEYLAYNLYANDLYIKHYSRLRAEINCRPDLKEKVYHNILKMISLDTDKLDEIHKVSKIMM